MLLGKYAFCSSGKGCSAKGCIAALSAALEGCLVDALAGRYDRAGIREGAAAWTVADFRRAIADHAREVLQRWQAHDR